MPRKPDKDGANRTPLRGVRCEDDLWLPCLAKAKRKDETLSQVIRRSLRAYLEEDE